MDKFWLNLARRMPRKLIMWCFVVLFSEVTTGEYSNTECSSLTCMDALKRWDEKEKLK